MARRRWGSVQKRNGQWMAVYRPYKGSPKQTWERAYPNTSTRAEEILAQRRAEIASGTWDDPHRKLTFASLSSEWFRTMSGSWKVGTVTLRQTNLERHILPALGELDVRRIDGPTLQRFTNDLTMAPQTVRLIVGQVRQILKWGHRHGRIRTLPDLVVAFPALRRKRVDPLTPAEVKAVLDQAFEYRVLLLWAVTTGMRQGEILAAKWTHLKDGTYAVTESLQRDMTTTSPKTGEEGDVWVAPVLRAALVDQRAQIAAWRLAAASWKDRGLIFPNRSGGYMGHRTAARAMERACDAAGVSRRSFHALRHTCASLLLDQGENILTVAKQLRHADPGVTLRVYSHLMPDRGADAVAKLGEMVA